MLPAEELLTVIEPFQRVVGAFKGGKVQLAEAPDTEIIPEAGGVWG